MNFIKTFLFGLFVFGSVTCAHAAVLQVPKPSLSSISPSKVNIDGSISILGSNFDKGTSVYVDGHKVNASLSSSKKFTLGLSSTSANKAGSHKVYVSNKYGKSGTLSFTVNPEKKTPPVKPPVTVSPKVTVLVPNGGESVTVGDRIDIIWKTAGLPAGTKVNIYKVENGLFGEGAPWPIVSGLSPQDATSTYSWVVDYGVGFNFGRLFKMLASVVSAGSDNTEQIKILVEAVLPNGNKVSDKSDNYFSVSNISNSAITVLLKTPGSTYQLQSDGSVNIPFSWSSSRPNMLPYAYLLSSDQNVQNPVGGAYASVNLKSSVGAASGEGSNFDSYFRRLATGSYKISVCDQSTDIKYPTCGVSEIFQIATSSGVAEPEFSIVSASVQKLYGQDANGIATTTVLATQNIRIKALGGDLYFAPQVPNNTFTFKVYKDGQEFSGFSPLYVLWSVPRSGVVTAGYPVGSFVLQAGNEIIIPVQFSFYSQNKGFSVPYGSYKVKVDTVKFQTPPGVGTSTTRFVRDPLNFTPSIPLP